MPFTPPPAPGRFTTTTPNTAETGSKTPQAAKTPSPTKRSTPAMASTPRAARLLRLQDSFKADIAERAAHEANPMRRPAQLRAGAGRDYLQAAHPGQGIMRGSGVWLSAIVIGRCRVVDTLSSFGSPTGVLVRAPTGMVA